MERFPGYLGDRSRIVSSAQRFRFFFFQAEDGIRDDLVTGVQTCALPICAAVLYCEEPMVPVLAVPPPTQAPSVLRNTTPRRSRSSSAAGTPESRPITKSPST